MELQAALEATRDPTGPITVVLADGYYRREYLVPSRGNDNTAPPLTITAANPGRAIIDGADPVTDLAGPDAQGVWSFPWTEGWGPSTWRQPQIAHFEHPLYYRREMIFLNDRRLDLVMAPDGLAPAPELQPGQFTVDEVAGVIRLKPAGLLRPGIDRVEVSRRGVRRGGDGTPGADAVPLLRANGIAHLTIDGLVVRRSAAHNMASAFEASAIGITRATFDQRLRNLVITRCRFVDNGGKGLGGRHWIGVVVRDCELSGNANGGGALQRSDEVLFEDCTFADNSWRFGSWMNTWDAAGTKILDGSCQDRSFTGRSRQRIYRRCGFLRNGAGGFWHDWGPQDLVLENCLIEGNSTGVQIEITSGPVLLRDTVIRNHGGGALYGVNAPDVTLERCVLIDAIDGVRRPAVPGPWVGKGLISIAGDPRNESAAQLPSMARTDQGPPPAHPPAEHYRTQRWVIRDSVIQANLPEGRLFWARYWGEPAEVGFNPAPSFAATFTSVGNRFFQIGPEDPFLAPDALPAGTDPFAIRYASEALLDRCDPTATWDPVSPSAIAALDPRDGKPLDPRRLPAATTEERAVLFRQAFVSATQGLRLAGDGGDLHLSLRNPFTQDLTVQAEVDAGAGWLVHGPPLVLPPGRAGVLRLRLLPADGHERSSATVHLRCRAVAPGVEPIQVTAGIALVASTEPRPAR